MDLPDSENGPPAQCDTSPLAPAGPGVLADSGDYAAAAAKEQDIMPRQHGPWVRGRRQAQAGKDPAPVSGLVVPHGIARFPRGPDGTRGFHPGSRPEMDPGDSLSWWSLSSDCLQSQYAYYSSSPPPPSNVRNNGAYSENSYFPYAPATGASYSTTAHRKNGSFNAYGYSGAPYNNPCLYPSPSSSHLMRCSNLYGNHQQYFYDSPSQHGYEYLDASSYYGAGVYVDYNQPAAGYGNCRSKFTKYRYAANFGEAHYQESPYYAPQSGTNHYLTNSYHNGYRSHEFIHQHQDKFKHSYSGDLSHEVKSVKSEDSALCKVFKDPPDTVYSSFSNLSLPSECISSSSLSGSSAVCPKTETHALRTKCTPDHSSMKEETFKSIPSQITISSEKEIGCNDFKIQSLKINDNSLPGDSKEIETLKAIQEEGKCTKKGQGIPAKKESGCQHSENSSLPTKKIEDFCTPREAAGQVEV